MSWRAEFAHRHRRVEIDRPAPTPMPTAAPGTPEWKKQLNEAMSAAGRALARSSEGLLQQRLNAIPGVVPSQITMKGAVYGGADSLGLIFKAVPPPPTN